VFSPAEISPFCHSRSRKDQYATASGHGTSGKRQHFPSDDTFSCEKENLTESLKITG